MENYYSRLLVPVDESPQADHSFRKAVAIAKRNNAKIFLVHVMDTRIGSLTPENSQVELSEMDQVFLTDKETLAHDAGVEVERIVVNGNPKTLIAETFPQEYGIDLIIIGATGKGAINRALVGSVSSHVLKHAKCDVLLVR